MFESTHTCKMKLHIAHVQIFCNFERKGQNSQVRINSLNEQQEDDLKWLIPFQTTHGNLQSFIHQDTMESRKNLEQTFIFQTGTLNPYSIK